jgi:hypothetical protein
MTLDISRPALESQFFSGFWIGWMIEHPTKSNPGNPKEFDVQCQKSEKVGFYFRIFVELLDWIGIFKFNPTQ